MRVAILLGVSEYSSLSSLDAVSRDISVVKALLEATGEFGSLLSLAGRLEAEPTKRKIIEFHAEHQQKVIDEVLFYYSGHGELFESNLIYPMSNYSKERLRQSSLEDRELDNYLRQLNAKVTVKIVDCCHSGSRYIKGALDTKEAIDSSATRFDNCYFFYSCRQDQKSWASEEDSGLSVFTREFISAVVSQVDGPVRYKQIADALSDAPSDPLHDQEPQFAIQGSMKHNFCVLNDSIRAVVGALGPEEPEDTGEVHVEATSILAAVKDGAERCLSADEAEKTLEKILHQLGEVGESPELAPFYEEKMMVPDMLESFDVAGEVALGKWLKGSGRMFFGWAEESDPKSGLLSSLSYMPGYWEKPRVIGFGTSSGLRPDRVIIQLTPRYPNLIKWEFAAVFFWSVEQLAVFSYLIPLIRGSWQEFDQPEEVAWNRKFFERGNLPEAADYVAELRRVFHKTVLGELERRFG